MIRIKIMLSYNGNNFLGWQKQKNSEQTIQGQLEKIISNIFNQPVRVIGSGRTDRGVHAIKQYAHFDIDNFQNSEKERKKIKSIKLLLPKDILIHHFWIAPDEYHAQKSVEKKTYRYLIYNNKNHHPFFYNLCYWEKRKLDLFFLNNASKTLLGTHNFKSFQNSGTEVSSTIRTIYYLHWKKVKKNFIEFQITGDGFLKQMVRNIIGTLLDVSFKTKDLNLIKDILEAKDRAYAKKPISSSGLYLYDVVYPKKLDLLCQKI